MHLHGILKYKCMSIGKWYENFQTRVSNAFYAHGLFCSAHPIVLISFVIFVQLILIYPITRLPPPKNVPARFITQNGNSSFISNAPRWFNASEPVAFVQRIMIKAVVFPWESDILQPIDAVRMPLSKLFVVLDHINNHQYLNKDGKRIHIIDVCLRKSSPVRAQPISSLLPHGCLIFSPALFWENNFDSFMNDPNVMKTLFKNLGERYERQPSLREMLFGLPLSFTGIKRFMMRSRQQTISLSVTLMLKNNSREYLAGLSNRLHAEFSKSLATAPVRQPDSADIVHIHYRDINYFIEYAPLVVLYICLFLYLYFSIQKIEMVKSKWGLAVSAVAMLVASLVMSVGILASLGFTPSLKGSEIFPYLVLLIGLENTLVVTKSVVSTPAHLEVKLRVAQGLSREGWYIFKNLCAELVVLMFGLLTFLPQIQEFCLFLIVGLLCDFFLQMFFFATVLSIDIRRMELADLRHQTILLSQPPRFESPLYDVVDFQFFSELPRRIRMMNFWARWRMAQRALIVFVLGVLVHRTDLLMHTFKWSFSSLAAKTISSSPAAHEAAHLVSHDSAHEHINETYSHWSYLLDFYNISLHQRYLSILPSICLSILISPEDVKKLPRPPYQFYPSPVSSDYQMGIIVPLLIGGLVVLILLLIVKHCSSSNSLVKKCQFSNHIRGEPKSQTLNGHKLPIECVIYDGVNLVASSCQANQIFVWDSNLGQMVSCISHVGISREFTHSSSLGRNSEVSETDIFSKFHSVDQKDDHSRKSLEGASDKLSMPDKGSQDVLDNSWRQEILPPRIRRSGSNRFHFPAPDLHNFINVDFHSLATRSRSASDLIVHSGEAAFDFNVLNQPHFGEEQSWRESLFESTDLEDQDVASAEFASNVWCLECQDNLVIVGCSNGHVEVWNARTGLLRTIYRGSSVGITAIKYSQRWIIAGRLSGSVDFLKLDACRGAQSPAVVNSPAVQDPVKCCLLGTSMAHRSAVSLIGCTSCHVVTASHDCLLKVFRLVDLQCVYTLHGHTEPITCLHLDAVSRPAIVSAAQDGSVRLWDILTGACVHQLQLDQDPVTILACTSGLIVAGNSVGRLIVWHRQRGNLIHNISVCHISLSATALLTEQLAVCAAGSSLYCVNLRCGRVTHSAPLRGTFSAIHHLISVNNHSVLCDSGTRLHIVPIPKLPNKKL